MQLKKQKERKKERKKKLKKQNKIQKVKGRQPFFLVLINATYNWR